MSVVLASLHVAAFADTVSSPFSCQEQAKQRALSNHLIFSKAFTCPGGVVFVQLVKGQNFALCMSNGKVQKAMTTVCEVNPQNWSDYTSIRHDCRGSATDCAVEVY